MKLCSYTYFFYCLKKVSRTALLTHTFKKEMDKREKQNKRENGEEKEGKKKNGEGKKRTGKDKGTRVLFPTCPIFHP